MGDANTTAGVPVPIPDEPTPADRTGVVQQKIDQLDRISDKLVAATESPGASSSEERLTDIERAVKWASPWRQLLGFIAFVVAAGVALYAAVGSFARESVVETVRAAHQDEENPVEPSVQTVQQLKNDVASVKGGVDCLVAGKKREKAVKAVEVELELHRQQHSELIQEWSAKKAARRSAGDKPTKTDGHLALQAELERLSAEVIKQCAEESL